MSAAPILLLLVAFLAIQLMGRRRRVDTHRAMLAQLTAGDEVITSGGLIGTVAEVGETEVLVEFAPGTVVRVAKAAIIGRPAQPVPEAPPADETVSEIEPPRPYHPEDSE